MPSPLQLSTQFRATAGLGGFLGGMQDSFALANADRDLVDRDLKTRLDQLKLQEEEANTPLKAIERANKMAEQEQIQSDWTSGRTGQLKQADHESKIAEAIARKSDAEVKDMYNQATGMASIAALFNEDDFKPDNQLRTLAKWEHAKEIASRVGFKGFPQQYTPQNLQKMMMGGQFATSTIPFLQKRLLVAQEQQFEAGQTDKKLQNAMDVAHIHGGYQVEAAKAGAAARTLDPGSSLTKAGKEAEAKRLEIMQTQGPVPISEFSQYVSLTVEPNELDKLRNSKEEQYRSVFMANKDERERAAAMLGMPKSAHYSTIAKALAERDVKEALVSQAAGRVEGKEFTLADGSIVVAKGGKLVPQSKAPVRPSGTTSPAQATQTPTTAVETPSAPAPAAAPAEEGAAFGIYPKAKGSSPLGTRQNPHTPKTLEERNKLPKGAIYKNPNTGQLMVKG